MLANQQCHPGYQNPLTKNCISDFKRCTLLSFKFIVVVINMLITEE